MQTEQQIETDWRHDWSYHLIGSGKQLRRMLIERLGEDWLQEWRAWIAAIDAPLVSAYIRVSLTIGTRRYDLRNIGYTEQPAWQFSGHNSHGKWFYARVEDADLNWQELLRLAETDELEPALQDA